MESLSGPCKQCALCGCHGRHNKTMVPTISHILAKNKLYALCVNLCGCNQQYVGQTVNKFSKIWSVHQGSWSRQDKSDDSDHMALLLYCCDRKSRAAYAQSFTLWQQATIEFTCHDHSPHTLVVTFNRSQVNTGRDSTLRSLYYCLFAPHMCMVLFFMHIPFVVNHTINATPPERLQQSCAMFYHILL